MNKIVEDKKPEVPVTPCQPLPPASDCGDGKNRGAEREANCGGYYSEQARG
jgi:hypothetical protein